MSRARTFADLATASEVGNLGQKNIVINGDMSVAQRGTSSTSTGYKTVDRMQLALGQVSITQSQQALTSGSPYEAGFNNFYRMALTSTSSNASSYMQMNYQIEAQDMANSGWNFKSSSSFMTVSYWARSSLAGTYYTRLNTDDGTGYFRTEAFTLSADTWTKVTFTFEGNSNLTINDDNGLGFAISIIPHYGTTYTGSGGNASATTWYTIASNKYLPTDYPQNWGNTSGATFDVTGLQLEVGEVATPFKHETFGENLARCQRYLQKWLADTSNDSFGAGHFWSDTTFIAEYHLQNTMRSPPALTFDGSFVFSSTGNDRTASNSGVNRATKEQVQIQGNIPDNNEAGKPAFYRAGSDADAFVEFDAEL